MKAILDKTDTLRILGEHFGSDFDPKDVVFRADPWEIEIGNIPVPTSEKNSGSTVRTVAQPAVTRLLVQTPDPGDVALVARRADEDASAEPPPPGADGATSIPVSGSPGSVLAESRALEAELDRNRAAPRRRGGSSRAPDDFNNEV